MNIHHLELFYYVARHKGISEAVRHIPYGIQQPAVSSQILQLEDDLAVMLFQRRPFKLTEAGQTLYTFIEPFFNGLGPVARQIRGSKSKLLRIGASESVLKEYLPALLARLRKKVPDLQIKLRGALQVELEQLLASDSIDLAITPLGNKPSKETQCLVLLELPLILLTPRGHKFRGFSNLTKNEPIPFPLVSLPECEPISQIFQEQLAKQEWAWIPSIEVNSLGLITTYVQEGYGVGLTILLPGHKPPKGTIAYPLDGFPKLRIGLLWRRETPLTQLFLEEIPSALNLLK